MGCVHRLGAAQLSKLQCQMGHCTLTSCATRIGAQDLQRRGNHRKLSSTNYTIMERTAVRLTVNCKLSWASSLYRVWETPSITVAVRNVKDLALANVALSWLESRTPKGWGFDSWSGHRPRLWVQSPVRVRMGSSWSGSLTSMFLSPSLSKNQ